MFSTSMVVIGFIKHWFDCNKLAVCLAAGFIKHIFWNFTPLSLFNRHLFCVCHLVNCTKSSLVIKKLCAYFSQLLLKLKGYMNILMWHHITDNLSEGCEFLLLVSQLSCSYYMDGLLRTDWLKMSWYITNTKHDSAFNLSGVGRSSLAGGRGS